MLIHYLSMVFFHARYMMKNSYFRFTALTSPLFFFGLRYVAVISDGAALTHTDWVLATSAGMWSVTMVSAGILGYQRFQGTFEYLLLSQGGAAYSMSAVIVATALYSITCLPVGVLLGLLTVGVPPAGMILPLTGLFLMLILACASCALVISVFFVMTRHALIYEALLSAPLWILSGMSVPYEKLPALFQPLSLLVPLTGSVQLLREVSVETLGTQSVSIPPLGFERFCWVQTVIVSACFAVVGLVTFKRAAHRSRTAGQGEFV